MRTGHIMGVGAGVPIGQQTPCGAPICLQPYRYPVQSRLWEVVMCCIRIVLSKRSSPVLTEVARTLWKKLAMKQRNRYMASPSPEKMEKMADTLRGNVEHLKLAGGTTEDDTRCLMELVDEFRSFNAPMMTEDV